MIYFTDFQSAREAFLQRYEIRKIPREGWLRKLLSGRLVPGALRVESLDYEPINHESRLELNEFHPYKHYLAHERAPEFLRRSEPGGRIGPLGAWMYAWRESRRAGKRRPVLYVSGDIHVPTALNEGEITFSSGP